MPGVSMFHVFGWDCKSLWIGRWMTRSITAGTVAGVGTLRVGSYSGTSRTSVWQWQVGVVAELGSQSAIQALMILNGR